MKLNIKYELHNNIRIRRIRVGFRAQDINSNGYNGDRSIDRSIDRSKIGLVQQTFVSQRRIGINAPLRPATTRLSSFRFFFNTDKHLNKINISCKQS